MNKLRRLAAAMAFAVPATLHAADETTCAFGKHGIGYIYAVPPWNVPKLNATFPCLRNGQPQVYYDKSRTVWGHKLYTIEVLRDIDRFDGALRKGDVFQSSTASGEGRCELYLKKYQPVKKLVSSYGTGLDCVWLAGFADQQPDTFLILAPGGGNQPWFHLVGKRGAGLGWYLPAVSTLSPIMAPVAPSLRK